MLGTALLLFAVAAITDARNASPPAWASALVIGLLVVVIGMPFDTDGG